MGVLEFFGTLIKNGITASAIIPACHTKTPIDHFLIDFNSIIHVSGEKINLDLNIFLRLVMKTVYQKQPIKGFIFDEFFEKYNLLKLKEELTLSLPLQLQLTPTKVLELFSKHLNGNKLDELVITQVIKDYFMLLKKFLIRDKLKTILIAIDGVPSKGKMIEQKHRRYMGAIITDYKSKLTQKYKSYLESQPNYLYIIEENPIQWSRNKITPGTSFMHKMVKNLSHTNMKKKLFKYFPNLKSYIVSSMYEIGEGEKKIVNYVLANLINTKDDVMFYSPDADMILLAMLVPVTNMFVLRHNKQNSCYDLIMIKLLKENISFYINNHPVLKYNEKLEYDINRINYDLVCLSTIFGNDFVPKIETLNVKQGFQLLMDVYTMTLKSFDFDTKTNYLVLLDNNNDIKFNLNLDFLRKILINLKPEEDDFINNNDLYHHYLNYGKFKYVFSDTIITEQNIVGLYQELKQDYEYLKNSIRNGSNLDKFIYDDVFVNYLKKSINITDDTTNSVINTTYLTNHEFIKLLTKYKNEDFPRISFNLNTFSHSIKDNYHKNKIQGMNDYEKELYKFEKLLDEYYVKFNASPLDLNPNQINKYYQKYFHTDNLNLIMNKYIEGMLWVFNYYFNDRDYLNWWFYTYERAPLIRDLSTYCNKITHDQFQKLYTDLISYKVSNSKKSIYFNPIEQLIYVSPLTTSTLKLLPSAYRIFLESRNNLNPFLKDYFLDLKQIVQDLWTKNPSDEIDCHSIIFLNKCLLKSMKKYSENDDIEFIEIMRKIKISSISKKRTKSILPVF
jgi:5'-3' exonuclease